MLDRRPWRLIGAFLLAGLLLAGCGGGGGDTGSSSGGSGGTSSTPGDTTGDSVPNDPPALATPTYVGESGAATLNELDTAAYAGELIVMTNATAGLTTGAPLSFPSTQDTFSQTQNGPDGGTAVIQGRRRDDGTGWMSISYSGYKEKDSDSGETVTLDGLEVLEFGPRDGWVQLDLSDYHLQSASDDTLLNGSIVKTQTNTTTSYTENLVLFDKGLDVYLKMQDLTVKDAQGQVSIAGTFYDSRGGYIAINSEDPLRYSTFDGIQMPLSGGPVQLVGARDGMEADLTALNKNFGSIGLDADRDGVADEAARLDWTTIAPDVTPTPQGKPEADAGPEIVAALGSPTQLQGRYSHAESGGFVHFQWSIAAAPVGSNATLQNAFTANPTLTADIYGDYLLRLQVSDSSGWSSDEIVVPARSNPSSPASPDPDAGPDRTVAVGSLVTLDNRAGLVDEWDSSYNQWHLYTPHGSQAALDNAVSPQPSFTPDLSGFYLTTLGGSCCGNSRGSAVISVGMNFHLDPEISIVDLPIDNVTIGDLNNDGLPDFAIGDSTGNFVDLIYNRGGGRFSAPVQETVGNGAYNVAIRDINGDGLPDLITNPYTGIDYRLQASDGTFEPVVHLSDPSTTECLSGFAVAKLFGQSRYSVIKANGCGNLLVYPPVADGAVGPAQQIAITELGKFVIGDVTGDGINDLLTLGGGSPGQLLVYAGNSNGTFDPPVAYPLNTGANTILIGDLNGDGRNEVVLSSYSALQLLVQQPDGTLAPPRLLGVSGSLGSPTIGDINGDGRDDLVVPEDYDDPVDGTRLATIGLFIQQDDGTLSNEVLYPGNELGSGTSKAAIGDFDGDGRPDFVASYTGDIRLMLGDPIPSGAETAMSRMSRRERRAAKRWRPVSTPSVGLPALPVN